MLKKILKIFLVILSLWLCIGITDYILVAVMNKKPVFCSTDECCHYSGIGYGFEIYTNEYVFYIFGHCIDCNFTNGA
ncbi:MAG: hypothetical protein NC177_09065 [Ruminococcus flavefaciens]|nr:hypothetical protein [Ruminococcus flavefaciens]